jgi:hypothetical protein
MKNFNIDEFVIDDVLANQKKFKKEKEKDKDGKKKSKKDKDKKSKKDKKKKKKSVEDEVVADVVKEQKKEKKKKKKQGDTKLDYAHAMKEGIEAYSLMLQGAIEDNDTEQIEYYKSQLEFYKKQLQDDDKMVIEISL